MRILVISPFFYPHIGGSQRYMEELYASLLKKYKDLKVDVLAYNTTHSPNRESYKRMTIHRIGCIQLLPGQFALPNPLQLVAILMSLARYPYDVVHANTRFFESTWWAWIYAKFIGAKSILTDHVSSHPKHHRKIVTTIARIADKSIISWILCRYDLVTATNIKTVKFLHHTLGCRNAVLQYGGIDTSFYKPSRHNKKVIPNIHTYFRPDDIIITFAGRLIETKGPRYFVRAALSLLPTLPRNVFFVLAGDGPLKKSLAEEIAQNNGSRRIFMTGALSQDEIRKVLQSTDIFIHPSHHAEGFPNMILEAGATQNFVIASNNAGTDEIITDKQSGLLIRPKDKQAIQRSITWALAHKKERIIAATTLRAFIVSHYDWKEKSNEFFWSIKNMFVTREFSLIAKI